MGGPTLPNFELIWDDMAVLITCKNEEDSIKNEGATVFTTLYIDFFRRSRAANWSKTKCSLFPIPIMIQINLVVISPLVAEIFTFESVDTHTETD